MLAKEKDQDGAARVRVFEKRRENLILLVQASVNSFARYIAAKRVLTDDEEQQVVDPDFKWQEKYARDIVDEVGRVIKDSPDALNEVVKIFRYIGGSLTSLADMLGKY